MLLIKNKYTIITTKSVAKMCLHYIYQQNSSYVHELHFIQYNNIATQHCLMLNLAFPSSYSENINGVYPHQSAC